MAQNLKRTFVFNSGIIPFGLLRPCKEYAPNAKTRTDGVFEAVREMFKIAGGRNLPPTLTHLYDFHNTALRTRKRNPRTRRKPSKISSAGSKG